MAKPNANAPVGEGGRFAALTAKKGARLAAWIGRKKYGKEGFAALAAKGKRDEK